MELPQIGLGTWQVTDKGLMRELLCKAYQAGYRLIDTAAAYRVDQSVGIIISET